MLNDLKPIDVRENQRREALKEILREAMSCLPPNPHPDLVVSALAHMVWMARTDLVDLKRRLAECTG